MDIKLGKQFRYRISKHIKDSFDDQNNPVHKKVLAQFTPAEKKETTDVLGFTEDPLQEENNSINPVPNVIHKYPKKALILTTSKCPVYCRYCTRKRKTLKGKAVAYNLNAALKYVKKKSAINEVIFSGGDPLMLPISELKSLAFQFAKIEHIHYLRWHTRALTTLPEKINSHFIDMIDQLQKTFPHKTFIMVTHINLAAEITAKAKASIKKLQNTSLKLLNQSVLLKNINDSIKDQEELIFALIKCKIRPYYLHQLDRVEGSAHFEVPISKGIEIMKQLQKKVPAWAMPRYVQDSINGKTPLC